MSLNPLDDISAYKAAVKDCLLYSADPDACIAKYSLAGNNPVTRAVIAADRAIAELTIDALGNETAQTVFFSLMSRGRGRHLRAAMRAVQNVPFPDILKLIGDTREDRIAFLVAEATYAFANKSKIPPELPAPPLQIPSFPPIPSPPKTTPVYQPPPVAPTVTAPPVAPPLPVYTSPPRIKRTPPPTAPAGAPTPTPSEPTFTIGAHVQSQQWGNFLDPNAAKDVEVILCPPPDDWAKDFNANQDKAKKRFEAAIKDEPIRSFGFLEMPTAKDGMALLLPDPLQLRDKNQIKLRLIYSADQLTEYFAVTAQRSTQAKFPIITEIPSNVNLIRNSAKATITTSKIPRDYNIARAEQPVDLSPVLKILKRLGEILGVERFPAELPQRLIYPNGTGEFKTEDLPGMLEYLVRQIDRAVGLLPQKIKLADTNSAQAGNQSYEVEIHSFADFAREMLQNVIDTEGDVDVVNNMLVRCLFELGFIHQGSVQTHAMVDAMVEHMDFKQKYKLLKVPFAFDPYVGSRQTSGKGFSVKNTPAKNIDANTEEELEKLLPLLLKETEIEIRVLVNDERKSLNDLLQDIKRDTGAAAAAVTERASGDRLEELVESAQALLQLQGAIDRKNMRQSLTGGTLKTNKQKK